MQKSFSTVQLPPENTPSTEDPVLEERTGAIPGPRRLLTPSTDPFRMKFDNPLHALILITCLAVSTADASPDYKVNLTEGGAVEVSANGSDPVRFEPEFKILFTDQQITQRRFRLELPSHEVTAWQIRGQRAPLLNPFKVADVHKIRATGAEERDGVIHWNFPEHELFALEAEVHPSETGKEPRIQFRFTARKNGFFSVGYAGAPERAPDEVDAVFQPLIWHDQRFPEESFLTLEYNCSIPGVLATAGGVTYGVMADPASLPFRIPTFRNNLFGVMVRNEADQAQPIVFAPVLGGQGSRMTEGQTMSFDLLLLVRPGGWLETFEYAAREVMGFHDYRENTLTSMNQTLDNMIDYGLGEYSRFIKEERGFSYATDMPGAVKNVTALHPLGVALAVDEEEIFTERVHPLLEYLMSREKFLFSNTGEVGSQTATSNMRGPAFPVSELAELHSLTKGNNPVFLHYARELYDQHRVLNMTTVVEGGTWKRDISLYRATGDKQYLEEAVRKADVYLEERINNPPSDFAEAATSTFWDYILPRWPQLFELYELTQEERFLEAAVHGAREYATIMWFYPRIPDEEILVNKGGRAPLYRRGNPIQVPEESVPAWRVSEMGLIAEGLGTAGGGHRGLFLTTYAPYFLRIAQHSGDAFLRDIARSAMVGRYSNFPGYHMNMEYTTVYEQPDFPLRAHRELTSTSMHYNHIWVHIPMILDYLVSDAFDRSNGAVDFPSRYVEGYAYLYGKAYGDRPGHFYGDENVWLWMPRGALEIDNVQVNHVTASGNGNFYAALKNQSDREIEVEVRVNPDVVSGASAQSYPVRIWKDNEDAPAGELNDGVIRVTLSPKGITALAIDGLSAPPRFRDTVLATETAPWQQGFAAAESPIGTLQGMYVGTLTGMVFKFGEKTWLYGYLAGDFEDLNEMEEVTFHYRTGEEWEEHTVSQFPWEFSVPLTGDEEEIAIHISTRNPASKQELSEEILLKR